MSLSSRRKRDDQGQLAALYEHPNATASRFGIAQFIGGNNVAVYHGHDDITLETIMDEDRWMHEGSSSALQTAPCLRSLSTVQIEP